MGGFNVGAFTIDFIEVFATKLVVEAFRCTTILFRDRRIIDQKCHVVLDKIHTCCQEPCFFGIVVGEPGIISDHIFGSCTIRGSSHENCFVEEGRDTIAIVICAKYQRVRGSKLIVFDFEFIPNEYLIEEIGRNGRR